MNYIIGIDLGATYAKIGIVGSNGTIIARSIIASNDTDDYLVFIENAATATDRLLADNNIDRKQIEGIGVGAPNSNFFEGTIEYAHNIRWGHDKIVPFTDIFGKKMNTPCLITNDANAAAMGEAKFGIAKGMKNFVEVTLGTGVGTGIMTDGKIMYGSNGMAGEFGHCKIITSCIPRRCSCGSIGCLEAYCSATGVADSGRETLALYPDRPTSLRRYNPEDITAKIIHEQALCGDRVSIEILEDTGKLLGKAFADFTRFFAPEAIILFGGLTKAKDILMPAITESYDEHLIPIYRDKQKILLSSLPEYHAAILGASTLITG